MGSPRTALVSRARAPAQLRCSCCSMRYVGVPHLIPFIFAVATCKVRRWTLLAAVQGGAAATVAIQNGGGCAEVSRGHHCTAAPLHGRRRISRRRSGPKVPSNGNSLSAVRCLHTVWSSHGFSIVDRRHNILFHHCQKTKAQPCSCHSHHLRRGDNQPACMHNESRINLHAI